MKNYKFLIQNLLAIIVLGFAIGCKNDSGPSGPVEPRNMEVLFLGHDSEHHNSEEYLPYLASSLSPRGINFSYSSDPACLTKENLNKYDALAIYANHDEIKPSQNKALINFVKSGGGLIPIHCASYCFRNSDEYVEMVGGQFASHDTATFAVEVVNITHEICAGWTPFSSWEETYVHTALSDMEVLMERVEGDHREPYTWIKNYGKGRVFYTALGHDLRTWEKPEFHDLIYRGILWTLGKEKKEALAQLTFPTLSYAPAKIANYEKRDPAPQLQAPLSPEESMKLIQIPPDFELQLFASEPDIINPIAMNWDERGRLWIAETVDYPNEIKTTEGVGRDRIKICEDTDNDGKADKFTVFAENLSVPTSLVFANGGIIISQAPNFLFLKDTNGDDVADERKILMSGWGTSDTHAGPSNLRYGFDNKIWGVLGYSGYEGKVGDKDVEFGSGIYRFDSDGTDLEFMSRTSNNTWGLGFSENNDIFISTANNTHSGYYGIPDSHMEGVEGLRSRGVKKIDGHYLFHPTTRNFRQVDVFGGFTAAAGHALYTARQFPKDYWNSVALVTEPTGNLLHKAILEPDGAGFKEKDGWNLLASSDEWVSPVAADVGPDGAVWVLDWYNFIIQHNPTPPGFENGEGNAHINPLRDKQHGRIYKIVYKDAKAGPDINIDKADASSLIAALNSDNLLWRMHGQRLLVENQHKDVASQLLAMVADKSVDALGLNNPALHALWTLDGLGLVTRDNKEVMNAVIGALNHPADGVRKAAMQVLPSDDQALNDMKEANLFDDKNQRNLLASINKLFDLPKSSELVDVIMGLSKKKETLDDLWLARATYVNAVKHKDDFILALLREQPDILEKSGETASANIDFKGESLDSWNDIEIPKWLSQTGVKEFEGFSGTMWYRTTINLTKNQLGSATMHLPGASNSDQTFVNGVKIGGDQGWDNKRHYSIRNGLLKVGKNDIAIQIKGGGGVGGDPDFLYLETRNGNIPLAGTWKYKVEKIIRSGISEYADGSSIVDVFLKNYGPYAKTKSKEFETSSLLVDRSFEVKTIVDQMKYDVTELRAKPGEVIEIHFINNDAMQHNLLVISEGTISKVGREAERFAKETHAAEVGYVPEMKEILHVTPLLNPGEDFKLRFKLPNEEMELPFVCTFPGHWQTMNGNIIVSNKEAI